MVDQNLINRVRTLKGVFICTASIIPTDEPAYKGIGWRTPRGLEADETGPAFGFERLQAAAALYHMNESLVIVPSGGRSCATGGQCPTVASVASFELQMLGVPVASIAEEPEAVNTKEQIEKCSVIAREKGWSSDEVGIVSAFWHLPRIQALLFRCKEQGQAELFDPYSVTFLSAERVLAHEDPDKWNRYFSELYTKPDIMKRFSAELKGIGQLLSGHRPDDPNPFRGFTDPLA